MSRSRIYTVTIITAIMLSSVQAGSVRITDQGVKNLGSTIAAIAHCEKEGFIPIGTLGSTILTFQKHLTVDAWLKVKRQYQLSLHEKKQYTIAGNRWIPFRIDTENCRDLEKVIPSLTTFVKQADR